MRRLALLATVSWSLAAGACGSDAPKPHHVNADSGGGDDQPAARRDGTVPDGRVTAPAADAAAAADSAAADKPAVDTAPAMDAALAMDTARPDLAPRRACPYKADGGVADADARDGSTDAGVMATADGGLSRGKALWLVNAKVDVPGDRVIAARLETLGYEVQTVQDADATLADAEAAKLVLISASVSSGAIADKLKDAKVPVIVMEAFVLDDMAMTGPMSGVDYGFEDAQMDVLVTDATHPMAAGRRCFVNVAGGGQATWGKPGMGAEVVAELADKPGQAALFGYKAGAMMVGMAAPARRVAYFSTENMAPALTEDGLAMFDAAVAWAVAK